MAIPAVAAAPAFQLASSVMQTLTKPIVNYDHTRTYTKGRKRLETHVEHASAALSGLDLLAVGGAIAGLAVGMWIVGVGMRPATNDERNAARDATQNQLNAIRIELDIARRRLQDLIDHPYEQPQWEQKVAQWTAIVKALEAEQARLEKLLKDHPFGLDFRIERRPRISEWNLVGAVAGALPSVAAPDLGLFQFVLDPLFLLHKRP